AGALADQLRGELGAARGRAPVLPDDRAVHGPAGCAVPEQGRLALVRDPDRREVARGDPRVDEGRGRRLLDALPDLLRVVLDPAGPGEVLRKLRVAAAADGELRVDDEAGRARGALVDRER